MLGPRVGPAVGLCFQCAVAFHGTYTVEPRLGCWSHQSGQWQHRAEGDTVLLIVRGAIGRAEILIPWEPEDLLSAALSIMEALLDVQWALLLATWLGHCEAAGIDGTTAAVPSAMELVHIFGSQVQVSLPGTSATTERDPRHLAMDICGALNREG